ncbi:5108_t:CDS:2 [Funneliformis caledonium]|uniref:5108_t:CDS:1 n=1 Tax=Funneliformis caledonium TaxID=1117310 RepID=A0A9N9IPU8_9GLOM|nr:5108_t:CDS:2 [Funneliformis caledonium]
MLENTDAECSCPYAFEDIKKYFELASKRDFVPSLSEFVRENSDLLVRSPPEVNDFKSLDGAWKKRFTTVAKILNIEESISVFSFSAFMASQSGFALVLWVVRCRPRQSDDVGNPSQINVDTPDWNIIIEKRYKERITVRRREKTFTMYEKEHEIIGNQLSKDQENYLENYEPNNLKDDESTTAKRNEENHNKHAIASVSNLTKNKITALSKRPNSDVDSEDLKNNSFIVTEEQFEAPGLIDSPIIPSPYTGTNVDLVLEKSQATEHQVHPPEYTENPSEKTMRDGYSTTPKQYEIDIEDDDNVGNTSKRKTNEDDNDDELLENARFLFNELNEESLIDKVDENSLLDETRLPLGNINGRTPEEFLNTNLIESFNKYQKKIPKTRKILTPAYWGILDLTKESLNNSGIKNKEIEKLSQNFSNKIGWTDDVLASNEVQNILIIIARMLIKMR